MNHKPELSELLKRKFESISGWKPADQAAGGYSIKAVLQDTLQEAQKTRQAVERALEPFSEDAKTKIKEAAAYLEDVASSSSKDARSFLAKTLSALAEKIKP